MEHLITDYNENCRRVPDSRNATFQYSTPDDLSPNYEGTGVSMIKSKHGNEDYMDHRMDLEAGYFFDRDKDDLGMPEDDERRRVRRERNKLAASKCRNKRKKHIKLLVKESDDLEGRNSRLKKEINILQSEIKQLENMLDSHRCSMSCKVTVTG